MDFSPDLCYVCLSLLGQENASPMRAETLFHSLLFSQNLESPVQGSLESYWGKECVNESTVYEQMGTGVTHLL